MGEAALGAPSPPGRDFPSPRIAHTSLHCTHQFALHTPVSITCTPHLPETPLLLDSESKRDGLDVCKVTDAISFAA